MTTSYATANWQPDAALIERITGFAIPQQYIQEQVKTFNEEFRQLTVNQNAIFLKYVLARWRGNSSSVIASNTNLSAAGSTAQAVLMTNAWRPSDDTMTLLADMLTINKAFAEDAVPEFVIYWMERGTTEVSWNGKFIQHVKNQWSRFNSLPQFGHAPSQITDEWQPCNEAIEILRHANIDDEFILKLVPEFILYWKDTQRCYPSWNTKFIQHAKFKWAKQFELARIKRRNVDTPRPRSTRDIPLLESLLDRSWADTPIFKNNH